MKKQRKIRRFWVRHWRNSSTYLLKNDLGLREMLLYREAPGKWFLTRWQSDQTEGRTFKTLKAAKASVGKSFRPD